MTKEKYEFVERGFVQLRGREVNGYKFHLNRSGAWEWENPDGGTAFATPFWEDQSGIPVEVYSGVEMVFVGQIDFSLTGDFENDLENYVELITPYLT